MVGVTTGSHKYIFLSLILFVRLNLLAQFVERSGQLGINHISHDRDLMSGGLAFLDYNNDGFEDIYIIGGDLKDKLYENQGNGTFTDVTRATGLDQYPASKTMGIVTGDLDNDGYTDILLTTAPGSRCYLFWNQNGEFFTETGYGSGADILKAFSGSSAAVGDYDLDGHLDIYIGNYSLLGSDYLFHNNGDRTFTDKSELLGTNGLGLALVSAFSDFDNDHDPDILLGNDFGYEVQPNKLFMNDYPQVTFTEIGVPAQWNIGINSMGIAIGDYDGDDDLDYYISDIGGNHFFVNQGDLTFIQLTEEAGIENADGTSWGTVFFDYDNDTYLDLFVSNGPIGLDADKLDEDKLYSGNIDLVFDDISKEAGIASIFISRGVATGDYNNDGRLDMAIGAVTHDTDAEMYSLIYENISPLKKWLKLTLQGTTSNRDGYGTRVRVVANGTSWIREQSGGGTYLSHNSKTIHFGLDKVEVIDSLIITWPGGEKDIYKNINSNTTYHALEGKELFMFKVELKTICSGQTIFLQGKERGISGIYRDTVSMAGQVLREINTTRLKVKENCIVTGLEYDKDTFEYQVFPNPFRVNLNLVLPQSLQSPLELQIIDLQGRLLGDWSIEPGEGEVHVKDLSFIRPGVFFLKIRAVGKVNSIRVIKTP